ncbi:hypothetical protein Pr1d_08080 [Bythopirellula goksoeyrii]|uniref:Uncharacterized protein n=1 Tax=Bythopirellula goksoeyrii TaxID=1400387 RepID=A0A5B9Q3H2_9BACT|nr:hypothetical protein Pr1d_08080 [Bythopirellula goksoeyrii]
MFPERQGQYKLPTFPILVITCRFPDFSCLIEEDGYSSDFSKRIPARNNLRLKKPLFGDFVEFERSRYQMH